MYARMSGMPLRRKRREEAGTRAELRPFVDVRGWPLERRLAHIWEHDVDRVCELVTIPWSEAQPGDKQLMVRVFEVLAKRLWRMNDRADDEARANVERLARELEERERAK